MSDFLKYHYERDEGIRLDLPQPVFEQAVSFEGRLAKSFSEISPSVRVEAADDTVVSIWPITAEMAGRGDDADKMEDALGIVSEVERAAGVLDMQDPHLSVQLGFQRYGYGVFRMSARARWPEAPIGVVRPIVNEAMQQAAINLGYGETREDVIDDPGVGVEMSRETGVAFISNSMGASGLMTEGHRYRRGSEFIHLVDGNLYTHDMQFISLTGLVAFVKADEILRA